MTATWHTDYSRPHWTDPRTERTEAEREAATTYGDYVSASEGDENA